MNFEFSPLGQLLRDKGYIRGPFGSALKRGELKVSGVPVYEQQHAIDGTRTFRFFVDEDKYTELKRFAVKTNDLIISCSGTVGRVSVIQDADPLGIISQALLILRPNLDVLLPSFLYYFLISEAGHNELLRASHGAVQQNIAPRDVVEKIGVPLPTLTLQAQIVSVLQSLDARIVLLREQNATLEAIAQALFKSWFVDFDPVRAKQDGRPPEGMDEATAALFPDGFEKSELGVVPRGWRAATLMESFEINPKRPLKKAIVAPYLDMASLSTSGHCVDAPIQREMGSGSKFRNGDTLLARITPCLENGKSAFVDFLDDGQTGWGSTEFVVLRPKAPLPEYFGYLLCRDPVFREFAIQSMSGTSGRQRIQNDVLGRYALAVPNEKVATAFASVVEAIQTGITANHGAAQTLVTLRDTLLPRLISGQLRLPEVADLMRHAA